MGSDKKEKMKVGIFVAIGLFLFCASIILVGGDKMIFSRRYSLHVYFKSIQGLAVGSVVSYAGIPVGNIKKIHIPNEEQQIKLSLEIDEDYKDKITQASVASVKTQGALGDRYIYIDPGASDAIALQPGSLIKSDETGDFLDIITEKGAELSHVVDTVKEITKLLQAFNENGRAASIATNLDKLLNEGRLLMRDLRGGKNEKALQESIQHFLSVVKKIDASEGTLGALINDPTLHNKLVSLMGEKPRNKYLKPLIRQTIQTQDSK